MYKNIVVLYRGHNNCRSALDQATFIANQNHARLHIIGNALGTGAITIATGFGVGDALPSERDRVKDAMGQAARELLEKQISVETLMMGGDTISQLAIQVRKLKPDLLVIGRSDRTIFSRWLIVPFEESIRDRVDCNILIATA